LFICWLFFEEGEEAVFIVGADGYLGVGREEDAVGADDADV
jgi:hypothetical protein